MNLFIKQKQTRRLESELLFGMGENRGKVIVKEFGIDIYTLLYLKWQPARSYCIAQGTLLSIMWQPGWEGSLGRVDTCICWLCPFAVHLKLSQCC